MAYSADTFTSLEQPTLAKWNKLWANDAEFQLQTGSNFSSGTTGRIWWEELARIAGTGSSTTMTTPTFAARKFLLVVFHLAATAVDGIMQFNNDTTALYAARYSVNYGAGTSIVSQTSLFASAGVASQPTTSGYCFIENNTSLEKHVQAAFSGSAAGAASVINSFNYYGKWVNTASQITRIDVKNTGASASGNWTSNSLITVLGHD